MPKMHTSCLHADTRTRWPRRAISGTVLALLLMLQACGPGLGGTGTGHVYGPADFGAQTKSACQSPLAEVLGCRAGAASQPGAGPLDFTGLDTAQGVRLQLDPDRAWFNAPCAGLLFEGDWGQRPAGEQAYYGAVLLPGRAESTPAWLQVSMVEAGEAGGEPALTVTLLERDGPVLFGPAIVQRVPQGQVPAPATCP